MSFGGPEKPDTASLGGGRLLAEITNRIVAFMREHYGRGPIKAKTYVLDNLIVCVLSDGFTAIERTMVEGGQPDRVLEMRRDFQELMEVRYTEMIEELTGRQVLAFLSQAHVEPDLTIEMFLMDGPVPGFGALEVVDPAPEAADDEGGDEGARAGRAAAMAAELPLVQQHPERDHQQAQRGPDGGLPDQVAAGQLGTDPDHDLGGHDHPRRGPHGRQHC